jgi:hypothetical protein
VDGQKIGQSSTIARYVANKYGFAGSNDIEAGCTSCMLFDILVIYNMNVYSALSDMYYEHVRDIKDAYQKVRGITDEAAKTAAMEKWFSTDLPEVC